MKIRAACSQTVTLKGVVELALDDETAAILQQGGDAKTWRKIADWAAEEFEDLSLDDIEQFSVPATIDDYRLMEN